MLNRKKANIPDISYDLNHDGMVSNKEYFIARQFDKNSDGKLETDERIQAIEALNNNYESKFVWGLEREGSLRGKRIIQLRGKIVNAEDFTELSDTYPVHPISLNKPSCSTEKELRLMRKNKLM